MSNPFAIVIIALGLYLAVLGFRDKQGNLIAAFTGKPFQGLSGGLNDTRSPLQSVIEAAPDLLNSGGNPTGGGGGRVQPK